MTERLEILTKQFLDWGAMVRWSDTWWLASLALLLTTIAIIAPVPLLFHREFTTWKSIMVTMRKVVIAILACLLMVFPPLLFTAMSLHYPTPEATDLFFAWLRSYQRRWLLLPFAFIVGLAVPIGWMRYAQPGLSAWWRSLRTTQKTETQSDIRDEIGGLQAKDFDPRRYYKTDCIFVGLDERDAPIYVPLDEFLERNMLILGPTRQGKGVEFGVLLDQLIRLKVPVFYIDPKSDKYVPFIMTQAAKDMGKDFIYLDLNPGAYGFWGPFSGGNMRDRRARIIDAFGLGDTGSDADFYKLGERGILDELLETTGGHLPSLLAEAKRYGDGVKRLSENLKEWSRIDTFNTRPDGRAQFSVARCITNNAVVYVRGSIGDNIVKKATPVLITEIIQESTRLRVEGSRTRPLVVAVDEVRFVISNELTNALATSLGLDVKFIVATQSAGDLRNLEDRTLNPAAIEQSFMVNCQEKMIYHAADPAIAEWASALGGSKWIKVVRSEGTEINAFGGESWGDSRHINSVEEAVISENKMKSLAQRVAVLFIPSRLAQPVFTCWVPTDLSIPLHKPLKPKEERKTG